MLALMREEVCLLLIFNLVIRRGYVVSSPLYRLGRSLGGPQNQSGPKGQKKPLYLCRRLNTDRRKQMYVQLSHVANVHMQYGEHPFDFKCSIKAHFV